MKAVPIVLLTTLLLLPAGRVGAQAYQDELYQAEVCNAGRITVDVALAYKEWGFNDMYWVIDYWYDVAPGKCKLVYSHRYAPNNLLSFQTFPLYLAFAFTDSSGVWGAARFKPVRDTSAANLDLCVGKKSYKYRVDRKDPRADCQRQPASCTAERRRPRLTPASTRCRLHRAATWIR